MMNFQWYIVIITFIFSVFFSGMEIAFLSSDKFYIELLSKKGNISAKIFSYFNNNSSQYISTMLVGNCIALVVFCIFIAKILNPYIQVYIHSEIGLLIIETFSSTLFILVTMEFFPKNLFRINPNQTLIMFAVPMFIIYWLLYPIVYIINELAEIILRIFFGTKLQDEKISFGRIDLDYYVRENTSQIHGKQKLEHEVKIFRRALNFSKVKVRDCMVPKTEIVAINVNAPIEELKEKIIETRFSKILIYRNNINDLIGYTHLHELFKKPESIVSILMPALIVHESMLANEVLTLFLQQHKSMAIVINEFDETAGILTVEDIIEEIFGEIEDEHDKEELVERN
ncbi:MAG: CNNM domain-containing protein [Bacteroidota bacterium]